MWSMMELLAVKKSLKLHRPTQVAEQANSPCRGLLSQGAAFKSTKEKERQNLFSKKSGRRNKKRKVQTKEVTIQVGVMDDFLKIKRGETIPLKVNLLATHEEILAAAIKKHGDFNKRFDIEGDYQLVFKDGTKVNFIPGTDPPKSFVLQRYKDLSGFGFSRIVLYLSPKSHFTDSDTESAKENDILPPATWLTRSNDYAEVTGH